MEPKTIEIEITNNYVLPLGSSQEIANAISTVVHESIKQLLIKINRPDVFVNLKLSEVIERIISEYTRQCCEITAKTYAREVEIEVRQACEEKVSQQGLLGLFKIILETDIEQFIK